MDVKLYLKRIGITDTILSADASTLFHLQRQHLLHVPFENIDIRSRIPIELSTAGFFKKIVLRGRGGYCYECNGLFFELLQALDFDVRMISCRVVRPLATGPEFDHLALIVSIEDQDWLVDVGFGDFSVAPLLLPAGDQQKAPPADYFIRPDDDCFSACRWNAAKQEYAPVYLFDTKSYPLSAFAGMHQVHQTDPRGYFRRSFLCSRFTGQGRISLINNRLIRQQAGIRKERRLHGTADVSTALARYFGMTDVLLNAVCQQVS